MPQQAIIPAVCRYWLVEKEQRMAQKVAKRASDTILVYWGLQSSMSFKFLFKFWEVIFDRNEQCLGLIKHQRNFSHSDRPVKQRLFSLVMSNIYSFNILGIGVIFLICDYWYILYNFEPVKTTVLVEIKGFTIFNRG